MIDYDYGVKLLPVDSANLETHRANRNHPAIRKWCRQRGLIDEIDQEKWFVRQSESPSISMFEIWDRNLVGVCGLTDVDPYNRRAEFSLYIAPGHQGSGRGYKSLKTLCEFGFKDLGLEIIWGETIGKNPAAKMFKRVGFSCTGYRPRFYFKEGKYHDSDIYCIDAATYFHKCSHQLTSVSSDKEDSKAI